ncbi:MAG: stage II sporulation protein P [Dethiobacteria bacterium]|jgi:stage II sporulation protein P
MLKKPFYYRLLLFLALLLLVEIFNPYLSPLRPAIHAFWFFPLHYHEEIPKEDLLAERYYRMLDEDGREITVTGRCIHVGERYLTSDNQLYEVFKVDGHTAWARYLETVDLFAGREELNDQGLLKVFSSFSHDPAEPVQDEDGGEQEPNKLVAVYHTHNAESYVPTDGTDSINGRGGIHEVGHSFCEAMEEKGIDVIHDETLHLPHDPGAYRRSRETVVKLLQRNPDVIFDIHRDAAPPETYAEKVEGEWVTQIQFVVGQQNQNYAVNRQFAYDLKGYADEMYPRLVKGVFHAHGNYNQDLTPLNLLLEVGAHTNSRPPAEEAAALFSDVVAFYFYGPEAIEDEELRQHLESEEIYKGTIPARFEDPGGVNRSVWRSIAVILLLVAAGAVGFFFLNNPQLKEETLRFWKSIRKWGGELPTRLQSLADRALTNLRWGIEELDEDITALRGKLQSLIDRLQGRLRD